MLYRMELEQFPVITQHYTVIRNTVWQITDKDNIFILVREGGCTVSCDGNDYTLTAGDVFFVPAGHSYLRRPLGESLCTMTYLHFSTCEPFEQVTAEEAFRQLKDTREQLDLEILSGETCLSFPNTVYLRNQSRAGEAIGEIPSFSDKRQLLCNLEASLVLCRLILTLSRQAMDGLTESVSLRKEKAIPAQLRRAIGYIARHYSEPLRLDGLAEYCSLSKQQLIRQFKRHMNTTPMGYLTDYRLARAKELLFNQPQLSVKEIAAELGFENQQYFARVFAKHNGETPTHYRNRTLNYVPPQNVESP